MKKCFIILTVFIHWNVFAQDTFSIVAVDSTTKEVGSAGASCVDLFNFPNEADFIAELIPGKGAINTQASYDASNQASASQKLMEDSTPAQIIDWLNKNDFNNNPQIRQYGIAALVNGKPTTAAFTGTSCFDWKGHITGPNYSIQGNILLGKNVLDSIEAGFLRTKGDLKAKLMAALQGAKIVGADTRCAPNNSSTLFAYLKTAKPTDVYGGTPNFLIKVKTKMNDKIEPIDSLYKLYLAKTKVSALDNPTESQIKVFYKEGNWLMVNNGTEPVRYQMHSPLGDLLQKGLLAPEESMEINNADLPSWFMIATFLGNECSQSRIICRNE